jgi:hypothetical protein
MAGFPLKVNDYKYYFLQEMKGQESIVKKRKVVLFLCGKDVLEPFLNNRALHI